MTKAIFDSVVRSFAYTNILSECAAGEQPSVRQTRWMSDFDRPSSSAISQ